MQIFIINSIIDIELLSLILLFGDSSFLSYYYIAFCLYKWKSDVS